MIRSFNGISPEIHPTAFVSEAAYIIGNVTIGENSSVWPGAVVRGDFGRITIGKNTHIEDNCVIHTGTEMYIGDNVIVAHSAIVHCRRVGNNCLIGIDATLLEEAEIADDCLIAAGALVTPGTRIPIMSLVMGSPAEIRAKLTKDKVDAMRAGADIYRATAQEYKRSGY
jgi:carbonic anhydrase/acetyltransferase-like protein (isoleucine patch superfamily)